MKPITFTTKPSYPDGKKRFAQEFNDAFERVRRNRPVNFIKLSDLERELSPIDRKELLGRIMDLDGVTLVVALDFDAMQFDLVGDEATCVNNQSVQCLDLFVWRMVD